MTDYTPVYLPGEAIPMTASAPISGGQLVVVTGNGTVGPAAFGTNPALVVGVCGNDVGTNGRATVYGRGTVHESVAQGTVTAGDLVSTPVTGDTAGAQVKTAAAAVNLAATWDATAATAANNAINQLRAVLGIALTTASNHNKVRWMTF